jgi:hypothetical protein
VSHGKSWFISDDYIVSPLNCARRCFGAEGREVENAGRCHGWLMVWNLKFLLLYTRQILVTCFIKHFDCELFAYQDCSSMVLKVRICSRIGFPGSAWLYRVAESPLQKELNHESFRLFADSCENSFSSWRLACPRRTHLPSPRLSSGGRREREGISDSLGNVNRDVRSKMPYQKSELP